MLSDLVARCPVVNPKQMLQVFAFVFNGFAIIQFGTMRSLPATFSEFYKNFLSGISAAGSARRSGR